MKIFVIHYKKLVKRKENILKQFEKYNITDFEFVEIDRDELQNYNLDIFDKSIGKVGIAVFLSHLYVYKEISDKYNNAFIFEDDIILDDDFINKYNKYISQLPNDYDMLFIGDGCNLHIEKEKIIPDKYIYEKCLHSTSWGGDGATRCVDSYLINKKCAIKLCEYFNNLSSKINLYIDWYLNIIARKYNLKIYWMEPTIVKQGSENGFFIKSY
jgi:GR25 family glycosyltransferase involved in LPS biosynthesis